MPIAAGVVGDARMRTVLFTASYKKEAEKG